MNELTFNRVEIEAPADWVDTSIITLAAPSFDGAFRPNVVVSREELEKPASAAEYGAVQLRELRKQTKKYTVHKEEETVVGGRNAFLLEHSFRTDQNLDIRQIQVFVGQLNTMFTITLSAAAADFEKMRDEFARIARSLKLT